MNRAESALEPQEPPHIFRLGPCRAYAPTDLTGAGGKGELAIKVLDLDKTTPIDGIRYLVPPDDAVLHGRDGHVEIPYGDLPIPLILEDYTAMEGLVPTYDAVGRGVYHALRANPDCRYADRYANLLKDAYPHYLSEIATNIIMLDSKDVDVPYLDRKVNLLKIFTLLEPHDPRFPLDIGLTLMEKGLTFSALHFSTASLYKALGFLEKALALAPGDPVISGHLGELSYMLGRYESAVGFWRASLTGKGNPDLQVRMERVEAGQTPRVPPVDYLEAIGVALELYQAGGFEEAAAILQDVLADEAFCRDFTMPEIYFLLGRCYENLAIPRYAEDNYNKALALSPDYGEPREALANLYKQG